MVQIFYLPSKDVSNFIVSLRCDSITKIPLLYLGLFCLMEMNEHILAEKHH